MPVFMDEHRKIDGLPEEAFAGAHARDLDVGKKYGVNYLRYWFDQGSGSVYCLIAAPNAEAARTVHREAHGPVADQITEVREGAQGH